MQTGDRATILRKSRKLTVQDRLDQRVVVNEFGCWIWTGQKQDSGYGRLGIDGTTKVAHKFIYEQLVGPVPKGMVLDHLCHTESDCPGGPECPHRPCVNPEHLEPVSPKENIRRGRTGQLEAQRTHCPQNHAYTPENTRINGKSRQCRKCGRDYVRRKRSIPPENFRQFDADWGSGENLAAV